jgi:hypothetical protein
MDIDPEWLKQHGPAIFASLEFKGQLDCLGNVHRHDAAAKGDALARLA